MSTQKLIGVLCKDSGRSQAIGEQLQIEGAVPQICHTTDELYRIVCNSRIDGLIIEQDLGGFLTGLDITARLSTDLVRPTTVLLGELTVKEQPTASALRINAVLPHDASPQRITSTMLSALLSAIHAGLPIPYAARALVRDADFIQPLPQLIVRVAGYLDDPNASVPMLTKELSADARVTAELLKVINGAATGLSEKITRLQDAVNLIGIRRTVALALSTYVLGHAAKTRSSLPRGLEQQLRLRSILTAATAATFASMTGGKAPDMAYVLGLLQDLGMLVMAHELGGSYQQLLHRCRTVAQLQLAGYEQHELGFSHADVSAALLQKWELPPALIRLALVHHQRLEEFEGNESEVGLLQAMQLGEAFADLKDQPTPQRRLHLHRLVQGWGMSGSNFLRDCLSRATAKAAELAAVFNVPVPDQRVFARLVRQFSDDPELQVHDEPQSGTPVPHLVQKAGASAPVVIVVDDDPGTLEIVAEYLQNTPYQCVCATKPEDVAADFARASVILLDLHLECTSGIDVLRGLRARGIVAPIVIISADRTRHAVMEAIAAGACDFLPKPLRRDSLLKKISRCSRRAGRTMRNFVEQNRAVILP